MGLTGEEQFNTPCFLGDLAADSDAVKPIIGQTPSTHTMYFDTCKIGANTALAKQASNIQDITIKTVGGTCIAWWSNNNTGGSALVAGDWTSMTMITQSIPANTTIYVTCVKAASGSAISGAVILVDAYPLCG